MRPLHAHLIRNFNIKIWQNIVYSCLFILKYIYLLKAFPKSTLYSSLTCLKVDIEDGLAQPGFSKSLSKHDEETQNVSKNMKLNDDDVDIDEKRHEENPYGDLYLNEKPIPDIVVANLGNVIEENSKNEDDGFKKNYSVCKYLWAMHL